MSGSDSTVGGTEAGTGAGVGEGVGVLPQQAQEIADGYAVGAATLDLRALLWDGACLPGAQLRIPLPATELDAAGKGSSLYGRYAHAVDRESVYEKLTAEHGAEQGAAAEAAAVDTVTS
ncbi:hypothetical protein [Streptomyces sp. NPDC051286]|uniref:hypothetical protein n=1 Tax=Streptomyces sp. NPDC051286 TaxID=3365647 RepID=UPI0037B652ED